MKQVRWEHLTPPDFEKMAKELYKLRKEKD